MHQLMDPEGKLEISTEAVTMVQTGILLFVHVVAALVCAFEFMPYLLSETGICMLTLAR